MTTICWKARPSTCLRASCSQSQSQSQSQLRTCSWVRSQRKLMSVALYAPCSRVSAWFTTWNPSCRTDSIAMCVHLPGRRTGRRSASIGKTQSGSLRHVSRLSLIPSLSVSLQRERMSTPRGWQLGRLPRRRDGRRRRPIGRQWRRSRRRRPKRRRLHGCSVKWLLQLRLLENKNWPGRRRRRRRRRSWIKCWI